MKLQSQAAARRNPDLTRGRIVVAVAEEYLATEVLEAVAATGQEIIEIRPGEPLPQLRAGQPALLASIWDPGLLAAFEIGGREQLPAWAQQAPILLVEPEPGPANFRQAVALGAQQALVLPAQLPELLQCLSQLSDEATDISSRAVVVAVAGAVGGAGASVLAASLAQELAARGPCVLVDAAGYSGGADLLCGIERAAGVRWQDLSAGGQVRGSELFQALPQTATGVAILSTARGTATPLPSSGAVQEPTSPRWSLWEDCPRLNDLSVALGALGQASSTVVMDLGPVHLHSARLWEFADLVIFLVPAECRAMAVAARLVQLATQHKCPVVQVLRHRTYSAFSAQDCEDLTGAPVVAELPTLPRLAAVIERTGLPAQLPRKMRQVCAQLIDEIVLSVGGVRR